MRRLWQAPEFISLDQTIKGNPVKCEFQGLSKDVIAFPDLLGTTKALNDSTQMRLFKGMHNQKSK